MNLMDHWLLPTLISAVALGFYDICKKHAVHGNSVMPVLFLSTFSGTFFFILTAFAGGDIAAYFACTPRELLLIFSLCASSFWVIPRRASITLTLNFITGFHPFPFGYCITLFVVKQYEKRKNISIFVKEITQIVLTNYEFRSIIKEQ